MEYNTQRSLLRISEYGRNIEKMIEYTCTIEDRERRNRAAKTIVAIMCQLNNPQRLDSAEFKQKIWDHLFMISEYKLDVDSPFPKPDPNIKEIEKYKCSYPHKYIKFRQYGKYIENMIVKAIDYEEGEEKESLVLLIANHLKKLYLSWNRDSVTDEVIVEHLSILSEGKLKLSENIRLENTRDLIAMTTRKKNTSNKPVDNQNGKYRDNKNWKKKINANNSSNQ
ncbi:MAG: DUF4290 domain-containing protein [Bacteroidota bacterium]